MIEILPANSPDEIQSARDLFLEYQRFIGVDLCFQGFEKELAALPGDYAPPSGRILLARSNADVAGCIALRRLSDSACEMKRLFVRPAFHRQGIARKLVNATLQAGRAIGYASMRLDTLPAMREATALYVSLGFKPIPADNTNPVAGALYFELRL